MIACERVGVKLWLSEERRYKVSLRHLGYKRDGEGLIDVINSSVLLLYFGRGLLV